ncbi:MAG TPA: recombinase family protein, partial [Thermoleophilia bacterium]|nr:recombinase family protein [Thermoleophilia bacterium]
MNAIYARYSSHVQDRGTSIDVQLESCRRLAGADAATYIDRAVTGTTMEREAFGRMMADAAVGRIHVLYVYRFDRFGRDAEAHRYIKMLESAGVRVVSTTEGEDPLTRGIHLV